MRRFTRNSLLLVSLSAGVLLFAFLLIHQGGALSPVSVARAGSSPYLPEGDATSEFMIGNISVGVFLLESSETNAAAENTEDWNATELHRARNEILDSFNWWEARAAENNSYVNFSWEFHERVNVSLEPINHKSTTSDIDRDMWQWVDEATDALGYEEKGKVGIRQYLNDLRDRQGTTWAFAVFVVDSSNDEDNEFPDDNFAFAMLGGPFYVMTYGNQNYGIENMDAVAAHETTHMFFALDEYSEAKEPSDKRSGYLNVRNGNSEYGGAAKEESIMLGGIEPYTNGDLSVFARGAIGWWDEDRDGIVDILDTEPETELESAEKTVFSTEFTINGTARIHLLENKNSQVGSTGKNYSLNTIGGVEYSVNGGDWRGLGLVATDGTFDQQVENFTLTLLLPNGSHEIRTRAFNSVGNWELNPGIMTVHVDLRNAPQVEILSPVSGGVELDVVNISWAISDMDGYVTNISLYYLPLEGLGGAEDYLPIVEMLPGDTEFYLWESYSVFGLGDGEYLLLVTAVDNSSIVGSNMTSFYLNNPTDPEVRIVGPMATGAREGELRLNWIFRDNDVPGEQVNSSFLMSIMLTMVHQDAGVFANYSLYLYNGIRPSYPYLQRSTEYGSWEGDPQDAFQIGYNWTLNMSLVINSLAVEVGNFEDLPDWVEKDELNKTFRIPDGQFLFTVRVWKSSNADFEHIASSQILELDNPDAPVVVLAMVGSFGQKDHVVVRERFTLSAQGSYDPDTSNGFLDYFWDLGDDGIQSGEDLTLLQMQYSLAGNYSITLTVQDETGRNTSLEFTIPVWLDYPFQVELLFGNFSQEQQGWVWEDEELPFTPRFSDENFSSGDYHLRWVVYPAGSPWTAENEILEDTGKTCSLAIQWEGIFDVVLFGVDSVNGNVLAFRSNVSIQVVNKAPVAVTPHYLRVNSGETIFLDASASVDTPSDLENLSFLWYLEDPGKGGVELGSGRFFNHSFQESGFYNIHLRVSDDDGNTTQVGVYLQVNEYAIMPTLIVSKSWVGVGEELHCTGSIFQEEQAEDFDEETFVQGLSFLWDFGDGIVGSGKEMVHAFSKPGNFQITLTIVDNDTQEESGSYMSIVIVNVSVNPTAIFTLDIPDGHDGPVVGVELIFDASESSSAMLAYVWDFGDGTVHYYFDDEGFPGFPEEMQGPASKGRVVTHVYSKTGIIEITLTVYNEHGGSSEYHDSFVVMEDTDDDDFFSSIRDDPSFGNQDFMVFLGILLVVIFLVGVKMKK